MGTSRRVLFCVAAPLECGRVAAGFGVSFEGRPGTRTRLDEGCELLATGVGPSSAGVAAAGALALERFRAVVSLGIGGAYPGSGCDTLATVLSTRSVLAGEGSVRGSGFVGLEAMGFGPFDGADSAATTPELVDRLASLADARGPIATVSVCSGTDAAAASVAERTGAISEAMEGAAVHLACHRAGVSFAEVRVISNIAGDRDRHPWRLDEALALLGPLAVRIAEAV